MLKMGSNESRVVSPEPPVPRPSIVFSTFKPSSKNVKELKDGTLALKLEPGEVRLADLPNLSRLRQSRDL